MLKRFSSFLIPIVLILFLFSLLFLHNLTIEQSLPSDGWSRSIDLEVKTIDDEQFIRHHEDGSSIYTMTTEGITHHSVDGSLKTEVVEQYDVHPKKAGFWIDGDNIIFINKEDALVLNAADKEQILAENVSGFKANEHVAVYWTKDGVFTLDTSNFDSVKVATVEDNVRDISLAPQAAAFAVQTKETMTVRVDVYRESDNFKPVTVAEVKDSAFQRFTRFEFAEQGDVIHMVYGKSSSKGGKRATRLYYGEFDMKGTDKPTDSQQILIYGGNSKKQINNPDYSTIHVIDGNPAILFSSRANIKPKTEAISVFLAKKQDGKWVANRVSTTDHMSVSSTFLDNDNIMWFENLLNDEFSIMAASSDPTIVKKSQELTSGDYKSAFYTSLLALSVGLIILFSAMVWIIPIALFILVISMYRIKLMEERTPLVLYSGMLIFVITEILLFDMPFKGSFYQLAPDYLTFTGSAYLYPVAISVVAWLTTWMARKGKDWDLLKELSYFVGINILITYFLFGPYLI